MKVTLVGITRAVNATTEAPENLIEFAGRLCYGSTSTGKPGFIQARIKQGHDSIIEHASASFYIEGISRACLSQLTRHRLASYSVRSQRYCDVGDDGMVIPPSVRDSDGFVEMLAGVYDKLTAAGVPKEDARYFLPIGWCTSLVMTANFREWRHFIEVRCDKAAQWEIRELALEILRHLNSYAPAVFGDLQERYAPSPNKN